MILFNSGQIRALTFFSIPHTDLTSACFYNSCWKKWINWKIFIFKRDSKKHIHSAQILPTTTASDVRDRHTRQRQVLWTSRQNEKFGVIIKKSPKGRCSAKDDEHLSTQTPKQQDAAMADALRMLSLLIGPFHAKASLLGWIWIKSISFLIYLAWPLNSFYVLTVYLLPPLIFLVLAHSLLFLGGKML